MTDAMESEFDTVAGWTEAVVADLGPDYAIPAACRGSASPAALAWLAESLQVPPRGRFLDTGAGLGGPAAWIAERYDVRAVLAEPMAGAAGGSHRLFALPAVVAWSEALPFASGSFDAAWALGVLSTTAAQGEILAEVRRVLRPSGRLGLLVFTAAAEIHDPPAGNHFPTEGQLLELLDRAGFWVAQIVDAPTLAGAPVAWTARMERVEEELAARHGADAGWVEAKDQERRMGELLRGGQVQPRLVLATAS
ncbi:MAG: class I SAM-dependent methyltransferase [Acidimicrobiales bacterium]